MVIKVSQIVVNFHGGAIESILTGHITHWDVWCRAQERKPLQWVINAAQSVIGTEHQ